MTEVLPSDLQQFVREEVASGMYKTEDEVVIEAVRMLRESTVRREQLRQEIQGRIERLDRGEGIECESDEALFRKGRD